MKVLPYISYLSYLNNNISEEKNKNVENQNSIKTSQNKDIDYSQELRTLNNLFKKINSTSFSKSLLTFKNLDIENQEIQKLKEIDNKVKAHEEAHYITGAPYTSYLKYNYIQGPNGRYYAISGEVDIDTAPENNPKKTIEKMKKVIKAALAPSNPSQKDIQAAVKAQRELEKAKLELEKQKSFKNFNRVWQI